jgi:hypothetical protein
MLLPLKNLQFNYFVSGDVCGVLKVWSSTYNQKNTLPLHQINLNDALSYNSMVEIQGLSHNDASIIVVALKSKKILVIGIVPNNTDCKHFILKQYYTEQKPSCIIQISTNHLAVATGFLNEESNIEIMNIHNGQKTAIIKHHSDMIDCLMNLPIRGQNPYIRFLVSVSRDNKMVIWKLFDGRVMHTDLALPLFFANQDQSKSGDSPLVSYRSDT